MEKLDEVNQIGLRREKRKKIYNKVVVGIILFIAIIITYQSCALHLISSPNKYESASLVLASLLGAFIGKLILPFTLAIFIFIIQRFVLRIRKNTLLLYFSVVLLIWSSFTYIVNFGKLISTYMINH